MLKLYNTLTRQIEEFQPENPHKVKIYTCGPTVYNMPHIGNFSAYVYWDLLIRVLKTNHMTPYRVLNFTDVGHLVSDGDDGEDKLEKGARTSGKSVWEVADYYIAEFQKGFNLLQLTPPEVAARATDYIEQDIQVVDTLTKKGYTYETSDGVYFDTSKFPDYAKFAKLDLEGLKAGARVEMSSAKRNVSDFALWKFIQPGEKHAMRWDYLGRPGYPGWHLECSTIIHHELGEPIDIHTGGIDHIPVHHTNEIAQSEAAFDQQLSRFWLHCNHLASEGKKISKSLGNGYTLDDLISMGYSPLDFKMWVLQGHYQSERNFSIESLEAARVRRLEWRNRATMQYQLETMAQQLLKSRSTIDNKYKEILQESDILQKINSSLDYNLNSPKAFSEIDSSSHITFQDWEEIDKLFGLNITDGATKTSKEQKKLMALRAIARENKNYTEADQIRNALAKTNLTILDTPEGQIWQYIK